MASQNKTRKKRLRSTAIQEDRVRDQALLHFTIFHSFDPSILEQYDNLIKKGIPEKEWPENVLHYMRGVPLVSSEYGAETEKRFQEALRQACEGIRNKDPEPAYLAIASFGPRLLKEMLADETLLPLIQDIWWHHLDKEKQATAFLKRIGSALSCVGGGQYRQLTEQEREQSRQQSASVSRSVTRWTNRFKKEYLPLYKTPERAWDQLEEDFNNEARFKNPQRRRIAFQKIHDRLAKKYPELHSYPAHSSNKA